MTCPVTLPDMDRLTARELVQYYLDAEFRLFVARRAYYGWLKKEADGAATLPEQLQAPDLQNAYIEATDLAERIALCMERRGLYPTPTLTLSGDRFRFRASYRDYPTESTYAPFCEDYPG